MSWHGAQRASRKDLGASGQEALNPKKINQSSINQSIYQSMDIPRTKTSRNDLLTGDLILIQRHS
jgi:hypothetical protein